MKVNDPIEKEHLEWVASRPPEIQAMIKRLPPDRLYKIKSTGQRVVMNSYAEDGTVSVLFLRQFNPGRVLLMERTIFGIKPEDLEEIEE